LIGVIVELRLPKGGDHIPHYLKQEKQRIRKKLNLEGFLQYSKVAITITSLMDFESRYWDCQ
jgi:hypothetical protein